MAKKGVMLVRPESEKLPEPKRQKSKMGMAERLRLVFSPSLFIETPAGWKRVIGPPELIKTLGTSIGGSQLRIDINGKVDIIGMGLNMPSLEVSYRSINGFSFDQLVYKN